MDARVLAGAIGCALALAAAPVHAQRAERSLAASAGVAVPAGSFGDLHGQGVHGSASLILRLSGQRLRLRPEVGIARYPIARRTPGTVEPLAVSPSGLHAPASAPAEMTPRGVATGATPGAAAMSRDVVLERRHTTLFTILGNVEVPLARGAYLVGGVGMARVRTSTADWSDEFTSSALTYNGGAGWRLRVARLEAFVEARVQRLSLEEGRGAFSALEAVPLAIGLVF